MERCVVPKRPFRNLLAVALVVPDGRPVKLAGRGRGPGGRGVLPLRRRATATGTAAIWGFAGEYGLAASTLGLFGHSNAGVKAAKDDLQAAVLDGRRGAGPADGPSTGLASCNATALGGCRWCRRARRGAGGS